MSYILDELNKINSEEQVSIDNNTLVKDSILLLSAPSEDHSLLEELGIDHQIKEVRNITNLSNKQKVMSDLLNTETYTGKQIRDLCWKYYLKLLPINLYRGSIPPEFVEKIKEFSEKNNIILTGNRTSFFILAPFEQFTEDPHGDNDKKEDIKDKKGKDKG